MLKLLIAAAVVLFATITSAQTPPPAAPRDAPDMCDHVTKNPDGSLKIRGPVRINSVTITNETLRPKSHMIGVDLHEHVKQACGAT